MKMQPVSGIGDAPKGVGELFDTGKPILDTVKPLFDLERDAIRQDSESAKDESDVNRKYADFAEEKLRDKSLKDEDKKLWQSFYWATFNRECDIRSESRKFKADALKGSKEIILFAFSFVLSVAGFIYSKRASGKLG